MSFENVSYTSGGNISPSRFVSMSAGNPYTAVQCDGSLEPVGISQKWLELYNATYHATSGRPVSVLGVGATALLELGGTVSAGDFIKSDSSGKGVKASLTLSSHQSVGARALDNGFSGEKIEVRVELFSGVQGVAGT